MLGGFFMEKHIKLLNDYMCNLFVEINNLNNMSFNVVGESFFGLHRKLLDYKELINKMYEEVMMTIKILGGFPITSIKEMENISAIKSMQSRNYNGKQVLDVLENDFKYLIEYTEDIIHYFTNENNIYTKLVLEKSLIKLKQEYWMITSSLKYTTENIA